MDTAVNALKLILLIGLGFAYLVGLGWLAVGPLLHGSLLRRNHGFLLLEEFPLIVCCGLIINYGLVLCFQSLDASLIVGIILSLGGIGGFIHSIHRDFDRRKVVPVSSNIYFAAVFVCLLFLGPILADPLGDWDARSIWFFHAKMIYTAGSIGLSAGWLHPSVVFSHIDYPNLIPSLAAQVGQVMGLWNEYLPKASLLFLLVPAVGWLFSFARRSFSFAILVLIIPFSLSNWLWNGYMDGYLALYFSIALLLLGRYYYSSRLIDLISSLTCFIVLLFIKNEGILAAISGLGSIFLVIFLKRKMISLKIIRSIHWKFVLAGMVALLPFFIWTLDQRQWNVQNNLEIGTAQSVSRIMERISDGSYKLILKNMFKQNEGALLLLGTVFCALTAWNKNFPKESLLALLAAGIYTTGMVMIYLLTPSDLAWHINTSIERTMLAVSGCIFVGSYYILDAVEDQRSVSFH